MQIFNPNKCRFIAHSKPCANLARSRGGGVLIEKCEELKRAIWRGIFSLSSNKIFILIAAVKLE